MNEILPLPVEQPASISLPDKLAELVRHVLTVNASEQPKHITAEAMTVSVSSEPDAIQLKGNGSGHVRLVIGGDPRITEVAFFSLDRSQACLKLELLPN